MAEPKITVNGQELSEGEAMTVRVALNIFRENMKQPFALGSDTMGEALRRSYVNCCEAVITTMLEKPKL